MKKISILMAVAIAIVGCQQQEQPKSADKTNVVRPNNNVKKPPNSNNKVEKL